MRAGITAFELVGRESGLCVFCCVAKGCQHDESFLFGGPGEEMQNTAALLLPLLLLSAAEGEKRDHADDADDDDDGDAGNIARLW